LHREFGSLDPGRGDSQQGWRGEIPRLQRREPAEGAGPAQSLQLLRSLGYDVTGLRSKSWTEFLKEPQFDFVFTVCDNAAAETCPIWPGQPMTAHWGIADPAEAMGSPAEVAQAFREAYRLLHQRIGVFISLPLRSLDELTLQGRLREIGHMEGTTRVPEQH
jgi:arsenate reductase